MINKFNGYIKIDGKNSSLILKEYEKDLRLIYFGKKIRQGEYDFIPQNDRNWNWEDDTFPAIFSFTGDNSRSEKAVVFCDENGLFTYRGYYLKSEIIDGHYFEDDMPYTRNKEQTLKITYKCENEEVYIYQYISCFSDSDVFSFSCEIENLSNKTLCVQRLMSLQLDFMANKASVTTFDGAWARERKKHVSEINAGVFYIDAKEGYSSSKHNPFFIADIKNNGYTAVNLLWSGNHKEIVEINEHNCTRVLAGINDSNFSYLVKKGEIFRSPEAIAVNEYNLDDITSEMHHFVLNHVIPPRFNNYERPALVNNWEGTYFDFTPEKLLAIADKASEVGLDMFVLDDGWFGKRINDKAGLGDWYDNVEKTGGLKKFKEELKKRNLKFGLWIEPEMINPDSDLYRAHPEYVMQIPGVKPLLKRNQLILDYANKEVCDYIVDSIGKILDDVRPDYIKWDNNRFMTDVYSNALSYQGGYYYDYTLGYYYVAKRLTERYPEILFEGCASGGNRFDLGVGFYMPQSWCSDNADAKSRTFIQEGTLYGYPQSMLGAHVSSSPNHTARTMTPLESRFDVASLGAFGYELDLSSLPQEELDVMKEQVKYYKEHRKLLQFGNYYRLGDVFTENISGWIIVSEDKSEAMVTVIAQEDHPALFNCEHQIKLKGLDDNALYSVLARKQSNFDTAEEYQAYGDALNNGLFNFGEIFMNNDRRENSNSIASRMFYIKKIK